MSLTRRIFDGWPGGQQHSKYELILVEVSIEKLASFNFSVIVVH